MIPVGRRPVQPPAGSDQRVAAVARRRHAPRQQLHARRRADHRHQQPRRRQPDDRGARRRQGAGAHLRRGDGPHRRRRVQHDAEVRAPTTSTAPAFFQTRPVWGAANNYFSQKAFEANGDPKNAKPDTVYYLPGGGFGGPIVKDRTFFWFASENYHDLSTRNISTIFPTAAERAGDFSALTNTRGQRGHDLRSADAPAVPGQHHPGEPDQPGRRGDPQVPAAAADQRRQRRAQLHARRRRSSTTSSRSTPARSSTSSPTRSR